MIVIALLIGAALLFSAGLGLILLREAWVAALWYRLFNDPKPYHPLFAEAPDPDPVVEVHDGYLMAKYFTEGEAAQLGATAQLPMPYVVSDHPLNCAKACCWEIRLDELHDAFDWGAYEHEMRSKR